MKLLLHKIKGTNNTLLTGRYYRLRWGTSRKSIFSMVIVRKLKICKQGNIDALISNLEEIYKMAHGCHGNDQTMEKIVDCLVTLSLNALIRQACKCSINLKLYS